MYSCNAGVFLIPVTINLEDVNKKELHDIYDCCFFIIYLRNVRL